MAAVPPVETRHSHGSTDYGAADLPDGGAGSIKVKSIEMRSCGSFFAGPDWPVLMLPWMLFAQMLLLSGTGGEIVLWVLTLLYGLCLSLVLGNLSFGRGGPWIFFSGFCCTSNILGLLMGLLLHSEEPLHKADGTRAFVTIVIMLLIYLLVVLTFSRALPPLGCALIGSSANFAAQHGFGWNPKTALVMQFASDCRSRGLTSESHENPEEVSIDLMRGRCYWSGEPALDYVFHLANNHTFIGVLLCHPANPYDKLERLLVLVIFSIMIVFPVAAVTTAIHTTIVRGIIILALVTLPRNLLRLYLQRLVIADQEILAGRGAAVEKARQALTQPGQQQQQQQQQQQPEHGRQQPQPQGSEDRKASWKWQAVSRRLTGSPQPRQAVTWLQASRELRAERAFCWEVTFFCFCFGVCVVVMTLVTIYVETHDPRPLGTCLLDSSKGLVWAFVLELIFDLLVNHRSSDKGQGVEERWFVGFFHRWCQERDDHIKRQSEVEAS